METPLNPRQNLVIRQFLSANIPDTGTGLFIRKVLFGAALLNYEEIYRLISEHFPEQARELTEKVEKLS